MIAKALESVVEEKVAEKAKTVNLDSVLDFIKMTDNKEILSQIIAGINDNQVGRDLLDDDYQRRLEEDDEVVMKNDIPENMVEDLVEEYGLAETIATNYFNNLNGYALRDRIKDLIDNL